MKFLSLQPFVPSGKEFERSKELFVELGFKEVWDAGNYIGYESGACRFILQQFDNVEFAQNFMLSVDIDNAEEFRTHVLDRKLPERFGIRIGEVTLQDYGKEVNLIDIAGVCWHFIESLAKRKG